MWEWLAAAAAAFTRDLHYMEWALLALFLWSVSGGKIWSGDSPRTMSVWELWLRRLARSRWKSYAFVAGIGGLPRLLLLAVAGFPTPFVPDEFSYQFQALTFAEGRMSNPAHPLWQHFEAIHVIPLPTYSSMYMPMQAMFLAAGKLVAGHLWWGVWFSGIAAAMALLWMLRGWFPPVWALAGALLVTARLCIFSYWTTSYWGGFVPLLGGALAAGGYARLIRRGDWTGGVAFGAGGVVLVLSRPFEGLLLLAVLGAAILYEFGKGSRKGQFRLAWRAALPCLVLCCLGAAGMLTYFKAVTGDSLQMPYAVNKSLYGWPLTLPGMVYNAVEYRHEKQRRYITFELQEHEKITHPAGIANYLPIKIGGLWAFYWGPAFSLALLGVPALRRRVGKLRVLGLCSGIVLAGVLVEQSGYPHYLAPGAAPIYAIWLGCVRELRAGAWRLGPVDWRLARALPVFSMLAIATVAVFPARHTHLTGSLISWCCHWEVEGRRSDVEKQLGPMSGRHLVFVRTASDRELVYDWVYNEPLIDDARIIWAEDMGSSKNEEVVRHYPDRTVWSVSAGAGVSTLKLGMHGENK